MSKPLVSVIIPVYQTEAFLDRCISSAAAQGYEPLEILLIDDGSTDGCPGICESWAAKDPRVRVLHKENQGLGLARNTGMDLARGDYLCFLDSDDTLEPGALEESVRLAQQMDAQLVFYGMTCVAADGSVVGRRCPHPEQRVFSGEKVTAQLLPMLITGEAGLTMSACCCLFSGELVRQAAWRFPSEREIISEDVYGLLELMSHVRRAAVLDQAPYRYYRNPNSLSRSYRKDRMDRNGIFYEACLDLCSRLGYDRKVCSSCAEPYLSFTVTAMKQAVAGLGIREVPELEKLSRSETLARALREREGKGSLKRNILFFFLKHRRCLAVYLLLKLQNRIQ